ncbi:interferon-inducible GTPase 5-like, partial [Paramuricea clavata]
MTDVKETTTKAAMYPHPTNSKITFWDLPGIGMCVPDVRLIINTPIESGKGGDSGYDNGGYDNGGDYGNGHESGNGADCSNGIMVVTKIRNSKILEKVVLFGTHHDRCGRPKRIVQKKAFNPEATLNDIRKDCLKSFGANEEVVFLISNHHPAKWDFARLTQAILDVLPHDQKESLTLTIDVLTSHSKDILNRKVEILRGRIWMVAAVSAAAAVIPLPGLSIVVDFRLLTYVVDFYKSQLSLPEEASYEFQKMSKENKEIILKFYFTNAVELAKIFTLVAFNSAAEEAARFIPFVGSAIAGSISFSSTYYFLSHCLSELEKTASNLLDETNTKV